MSIDRSDDSAHNSSKLSGTQRMLKHRWLQVLLSIVLFLILLLVVSPQELARELKDVSLPYLGVLLLISVALVWVSAAKWRLFMGEGAPSTARLFKLYLVGYFVNILVPSYVGGDATRSYLAGKKAGQMTAASATLLERYTGLVAMFGLGLVATLCASRELVPLHICYLMVSLAAAFVAASFVIFNPRCFSLLLRLWPATRLKKPRKIVIELQGACAQGLRSPRRFIGAMLYSLLYHCLTVVNTAAAGYAVGWEQVPIQELFVVLPIILTIGGLPITPSGLGIQEGAFVYFLTAIGATPAHALAIGILLRAKTYVLALVGWGAFISEQRSLQTSHATSKSADSDLLTVVTTEKEHR